MSDISWNSVGTALVIYLLGFAPLLFLANNSLINYVISVQASPEIIRHFLESLSLPVRIFFAGLSQDDLEFATQNYAKNSAYAKMRFAKHVGLIGNLIFSLGPCLFVFLCIIVLTKEENPTERAIYAALGISECIFWFYAVRFGRKLVHTSGDDSSE